MTVKVYRFLELLWTDIGTETLLIAEYQDHFQEEQEKRELEVNEYHIFGPSVFNMYIES